MSGVRDTLQRFRAHFGPGPRSFLAWWGQALATWLPARWRVLLGLTRDRLFFRQQDDELVAVQAGKPFAGLRLVIDHQDGMGAQGAARYRGVVRLHVRVSAGQR